VRGIKLANENDELVGMVCVGQESQDILVVSENGFGKRSKIDDYRVTHRGGKGVKTINITEKTGSLVTIKSVFDNDDLMIITQAGLIIRVPVSTIRMTGRAAQGVKLINLREDDSIASVARVELADVENNDKVANEIDSSDILSDDVVEDDQE
jgi:DNA gyrase subunit A